LVPFFQLDYNIFKNSHKREIHTLVQKPIQTGNTYTCTKTYTNGKYIHLYKTYTNGKYIHLYKTCMYFPFVYSSKIKSQIYFYLSKKILASFLQLKFEDERRRIPIQLMYLVTEWLLLKPNGEFFSYSVPRTSYISMAWWWWWYMHCTTLDQGGWGRFL
jgi:hypothetical protein